MVVFLIAIGITVIVILRMVTIGSREFRNAFADLYPPRQEQIIMDYLQPHTIYRLFGGEEAIVVTRYDRAFDAEGVVHRIHQEDLCQALGVSPSVKYAEQGGPSTPQVLALLRKTGDNARENVYRFILYLSENPK